MISSRQSFNLRQWGKCDYVTVWKAMREFTQQRTADTLDEVWLVEHHPVYTLGQRANSADIIDQPYTIPVILSDRGGRVTYHGPGQLVIYPLINLTRRQWNFLKLIRAIEDSVIQLLKHYQINAYSQRAAPGVYVEDSKIASLGLRIHKGCCYHGLAINVNMDLAPFSAIYPCGFKGLRMSNLGDWIGDISLEAVGKQFLENFAIQFHNCAEYN